MYNTFKHPSAAFYFINSRAWEMGVGTLIFFYPRVFSGRVQSLIFLVGLALIIISYIYPEYSLYSLVPVLGALLILFANKDFHFLNKGPLFYLGRWSYSIYLWHWPVCVFGYFYVIENWFYIGVPLSIFLGFISFNFIECSQFNKSPLKNGYTYLFLLVLFSSKYIDSNLDGQNFWVERQDEITKKTYQILVESDPHTGSWGADTDGNQDFSECRFNVDTKINEQFIDRINSCHKKFGEGILILGDSHAKDLFGMVSSRFDNEFLIGVTSTHGCRPHTPKAKCPYNKILDLISKEKYFSHIIFEQAGFYLMKDGEHEGNRTMFSKLPIDKEVEDITLNKTFVDKDIDYLNQLAEYTNVTWFGVRFEPHITDVIILKNKCNFPYHFRPGQKEIFSSLEEFIKQSLTSSNVEYLSQNDILSYEFPDDFMNCQNTFWDDGDHLSAYGEEVLGKRLPENFLETQR